MSCRHILGEPGRLFVRSATNPEQEHLCDLLEHSCGCASWTCRNRKYKEQYGHNFTCRHLKEARQEFLDAVLDSLREKILSK